MARSKKDAVYEWILAALTSARWRFGEALSIAQLAKETEASRQPIMAAINALAADGFVDIVPQVGCKIIEPGTRDVADFFVMFGRVQGALAELAAGRRNVVALRGVIEIHRKIGDAAKLPEFPADQFDRLCHQFQVRVGVMANSGIVSGRNLKLLSMADFLVGQCGRGRSRSVVAQQLGALVKAIKDGSAEDARLAAERYAAGLAKSIEETVRR